MSKLRIETAEVFEPLLGDSRYKGAHGGRGSGKSHFFAESLVEKALMHSGLRWVCIREVQKSLEQSVKRLIEDKIEAMGVGSRFRVLETEIHTPGGGLIIFQGMQNHTAESIKSLEGYDGAWCEEAQTLSQRSLDLLRPTLRKEGSELWFSWNPRLKTDPIDVFLREAPPPSAVVVQANYSHNPWLPNVLRDEMTWDRSRDQDKYAHIWLGDYQRNSEARVFRNWKTEDFETPADARCYFGGDWGFSVDPSVLVRIFLKGRTLYIDQEAYAVGCEIDDTPALFAGTDVRDPPRWTNPNKRKGIEGATKWPITADNARPETISYMQRNGFPRIKPAIKGPGSLADGVEFLKTYDIVIHPRCIHSIDEFTLYSYKVDKQTGEVLPVLDDKKNHVIDSARYALEGVRRSNYTLDNV